MIKSFHDHTVDTSLLKPGCTVLDVGCHGFEFGNQMRQNFQAKVYEVDINDLGSSQPYYRCGIADWDGRGDVSDERDWLARRLIPGDKFPVYTIASFSRLVGIDCWDVIKLDCEGSEYNILWNLAAPPAIQISVEFHQHTAARQNEEFMKSLIDRMQRWYEVKRHRLYGKWGALNYWDSLFILKPELRTRL